MARQRSVCARGARRCLQAASVVPVLFVLLLVFFVWHAFTVVHCGPVWRDASGAGWTPRRLTLAAEAWGFHALLALLLWAYLRTWLVGPGLVPDGWRPDIRDRAPRWCDKCDAHKPERAHHCSLCDTCVLKMDHHCPWVGNCVGHRNHKSFVLFLFYTAVTGLYVTACLVPDVGLSMGSLAGDVELMMAQVLCTSCAVVLLCFAGFHAWLISAASTTLEMGIFGSDGPYDLGRAENWRRVFGRRKLHWLLPVATEHGDGLTWERAEGFQLADTADLERGVDELNGEASASRLLSTV